MDLRLHIEELETERRWNRLQEFRDDHLGRFLAYRDQETFVWLALAGAPRSASPFVKRDTTLRLRPAIGSTITEPEHCARIAESPLLELRQYRLAAGTRARFAEFLRGRTYDEHVRLDMPLYGPFDALDDENLIVWFRGFPDLQERDRRKAQFYQGALWCDELEAIAMPMIEDYKNVLLLAPVR